MTWTAETLSAFKNHFALTDKQIGAAIQEKTVMVWKMRNGVIPLDKYGTRLSAYLKAVRAAKIVEMEEMAAYYRSFLDDENDTTF